MLELVEKLVLSCRKVKYYTHVVSEKRFAPSLIPTGETLNDKRVSNPRSTEAQSY